MYVVTAGYYRSLYTDWASAILPMLLSPRMTIICSFSTSSYFSARLTNRISGLSLGDFLLRQRVISLWREVIRTTHKIPQGSSTRTEMKQFAREEFERNRAVTDSAQIRYLVSTGKTQLDEIRNRLGDD